MRTTIADLTRMKAAGRRIPMLTVYDFPSARLAEAAQVPLLLVGDSLGMVVHGHATTLPVTLDDMVRHAGAVVRGCETPMVVADLPFLTYALLEDAVSSARRLMQEAGVQAVKLEGAAIPIVTRLVEMGVPVMGHLGFTPQSTHQIGVRVQGKLACEAGKLIADAEALQAAGAFAVVLELVPSDLARVIARRLVIPVIGIGAGAGCDGEVQVWHDVLGLGGDRVPRHARKFAEVGAVIRGALEAYVQAVGDGTFPTAANSSTMKPDQLAAALATLD